MGKARNFRSGNYADFRRGELMSDWNEQQLQILQAIHKELLVVAQRDQSCLDVLKDQLKELRMIVIGHDGSNGIRSNVREHEVSLKALQKWQTQATTLFVIIQVFGVPSLLFFVQRFLK